ncbi:anaphase-promoting complex subunit 5-domain-containing protein [Chlamydoabsidia padenii]|nr:anaphase-promoting complex subunit 5-domain-containing protein [Chlamydoabsidia padenii]
MLLNSDVNMKRSWDMDDTNRTGPIIRTRFITPFKIVLLFLIYEFCHFQMFPHRILPQAVVYLVEQVLKNRNADKEPLLQDIFNVLLTFEEPPNNQSTVNLLRNKLLGIQDPDSLFQFMFSLIDIMEEKADETGADIAVLDGASVFGLYVRRCRIEYFQSSVQQITEIFEIYRAYVTQAMDDRQLETMIIDGKSNNHCFSNRTAIINNKRTKWMDTSDDSSGSLTRSRSFNIRDPVNLNPSYQLGGWVSDHQMDLFLTRQAEMIEKTGTSDIPPAMLHRYLDYLQKNAPDIGKIHQVRFLNYIRTAEYEGAVSNLHRFFDYCFLSKGTPLYQYALLNLGVLEAKFGHSRDALYAFEDAMNVAREYHDDDCLNEIQSWISFVKGTLNGQYKTNDAVEIVNSTKPEKLDNSIYLASIFQLSQAQDMLQRGDSPFTVFRTLFQSNIQASMRGVGYINLPYNMIKFKTWKHYGNSVLSETYMKMALQENEGTMDDMEKLYLMASDMHYTNGNHLLAMEYLERFAALHPEQTIMSLPWKQAFLKVQAQLNPKDALQNTLDGQVNQLDLLQPEKRQRYFEALHRQAEECVAREDYELALHILRESHEALKEANDGSLLAKNLTLRAHLYMNNEKVETAIDLLEESLAMCKQAHDAFNYYRTTIELANAYLKLSNDTDKALYLIECSTPNILLIDSQELTREMNDVYAKAMEAHRKKIGITDHLMTTIYK